MPSRETGGGRTESVCLAAILKDEDAFVEEWIAHHRLLGIDHFFGTLPEDPAQEWRFSREDCMRHFVTNIACGKNEFVDKSALRYAEPVEALSGCAPKRARCREA